MSKKISPLMPTLEKLSREGGTEKERRVAREEEVDLTTALRERARSGKRTSAFNN